MNTEGVTNMKQRALSIICALALVVAMLPPVTASAAGLSTLTVGGTSVLGGGYWTTNETGTLTAEGASADNYNVYYDGDGTLTLNNATINGTATTGHVGAGIYAEGDLTIVLEGSSTVKGVQDPNGETQSIRVEGNLTIQGGGSLTAQGAETSSGTSYGIFVIGSFTQQGGSVTAIGGNINGNHTSTGLYVYGSTVTVQGGTLTATGGTTGSGSYGISANGSVTVSDAAVTATGGTGNYSYGLYVDSSSVTLSGSGSLTARSGSGTDTAVGIYLVNIWGSTGSVTVGDNSTLLANSVILRASSDEKPLAPTGDGSWLIYGQSNQTSAVGGTYTLTDDLTIPSGAVVTIPAGSTLTVPQGKTLTVNGTLNIANQSSLTGSGSLAGSGTFSLTNPDPVISGSETLTYDGTDQFGKFELEAPSGTVEVMGKNFAISSSPSLEGWNLVEQEIINAGTYTLTAKHTDGRTIQKQVTVSKATSNISFNNYAPGKTYDGTALAVPDKSQLTISGAEYNNVTFTWYEGTSPDGTQLDSAPTDAGTYYLVASIAESANTSGSKATSEAITINKGTYNGTKTAAGSVLANWSGEVTLPAIPDGASYGTPTSSDVTDMSITDGVLHYTGGSGIKEGQEYQITVPVSGGTNYHDYQIIVTLTGTIKKLPAGAPTLSSDTITYGQSLSTIALSGSMQDGGKPVTGTFAWADPDAAPNAGSYEAPWTFTPDNGDLYVPVSGTVTITVNKATPTGTPKYTAITTSGKTLADAGLTTEGVTFSVPGTVAWELADTTQVQANTAYTWKFTPTDSDNYNSISGSITLYVVSSSGGGGGSSGGGSSGSSSTTTEITKNPDGSTTTTVTNKTTGTVTETTKNPDGSQKVVETKKDGTVTTTTTDTTGNKTQVVENTDGSSKTTVDNKDGSGSVTVVDENGQVVSEATLSQSAVAAAQEKGEAVALPMPEVPVTTDRETAPTVTVNLPVGGSVKVEIPVEDVTAGTVAVIVKANGTKEVIKTSLTTENGVAVTLSDGDTVKVVDNSKTFDDVADNYWGAEAVDFTSSRELFAGTSATTFAPDTAMTRAMIVTVLARFEGVDTTTGDTWYEAGQQWAMQNGVSDGTNMDQGLSREQLATMLWRYAGSPSVSNSLSGYTDAGTVSSYAQQAMAWCVEQGIIGGTTTTTLSPQGPATRAQVATILMRYIENIA